MKTGIVFHELYLWHDTGNHADYVPYGFPVEPFQLQRILMQKGESKT